MSPSFDQHVNFAYTTVQAGSGVIGSGSGTSLVAALSTDLPDPALGQYNITVWPPALQPSTANAEIMRVTAKSGSTFTVTRAQEGSTALSGITAGFQVAQTVTRKLLADVEAIAGGSQRALVDPTTLAWSWLNQGSATISTNGKSLGLFAPAEAADNWHFRSKALPNGGVTPYHAIIHLVPMTAGVATAGVEVGWQDSSNNFVGIYQSMTGSARQIGIGKGSRPSTTYAFSATYFAWSFGQQMNWIKLADDGTNRIISASPDGFTWVQFHSIARTDFLTPTGVQFGVEPRNASFGAALMIDSWEEGAGA